jgi:ribonuclease HI
MSESDFAGDCTNRKSLTGYVWLLGGLSGVACSWKSEQQTTVATSTAEAEYMAVSAALSQGMWLQKLLFDMLGRRMKLMLYCDNQATVTIIHKGICERRTRHLSVKYHHVHDSVARGDVALSWVSTHSMIADCLTKNLAAPKLVQNRVSMGLM